MVYFIASLMIALVTPYYSQHPRVLGSVAFLTLVLGGARIRASVGLLKSPARASRQIVVLRVTIYGTFAVWGGFCGWTVHLYGTEWTTMFLLLTTAALAGGGSVSLAPDTRLASRCLVIMFTPTIAATGMAADIRHLSIAFMATLYLGFLLTQTRGTHDIADKVGLEFNFRAVLDCSPDAIALLDSRGSITFANRPSQVLFGYSLAELVGKSIESLIPAYRMVRADTGLESGRTPTGIDADLKAVCKDGANLPVEVRTSGLMAESGPQSIIAIRDVSERKKSEMLLHLSDASINSATIGMFWFTADGGFTRVNRESCSMSGYSEKELLAMTVAELTSAYTAEQWDKRWRNLVRKGNLSYESVLVRKDGRRLSTDVDVTLVEFEGVRYGVGFARDITERKSLEDQYRHAQKMETVGQLAGGIAHDFNNLLTVINGYSRRALGSGKLGSDLRNAIGEILKAGERAADLTSQLLIFARRQVSAPSVVDVNETVSESESLLRRLAGEGVEVEIARAAQTGRIRVDTSQFHQVLLNLVANARDAMPDGGSLSVEIANVELDEHYVARHVGSRTGYFVRLEVRDTGCGMDENTRRRVFEPFFTTKEQGTGLGLATVHGIVTNHGGWVTVESEPGIGTTFRTYWPGYEGKDWADVSPLPRLAMTQGTETVLLAEDQPEVRQLVAELLIDAGYNVLQAGNGSDALSVCQRQAGPIHLLLTDLVMPGMNGRELARRMKERRPEIQVIFMSGYGDGIMATHGILDQDVHLLAKPFTAESLTSMIRTVLGERVPRARSATA
jgi:PAS domain S-box-containing protein